MARCGSGSAGSQKVTPDAAANIRPDGVGQSPVRVALVIWPGQVRAVLTIGRGCFGSVAGIRAQSPFFSNARLRSQAV